MWRWSRRLLGSEATGELLRQDHPARTCDSCPKPVFAQTSQMGFVNALQKGEKDGNFINTIFKTWLRLMSLVWSYIVRKEDISKSSRKLVVFVIPLCLLLVSWLCWSSAMCCRQRSSVWWRKGMEVIFLSLLLARQRLPKKGKKKGNNKKTSHAHALVVY